MISNTNEFQPLTHRTNIVVDYIREIHLGLNGNETPVRDDIGYLWVNISTDSTLDENYLVTFSLPSGWGLICDSKVIDSNGISIDSELIGSISRQDSILCELINDGDVGQGTVGVTISDSDGIVVANSELNYEFVVSDQESTGLNIPVIGGVISISAILVIVSAVLLIRRKHEESYDDDNNQSVSGPPISGPPISTVNQSPSANVSQNDSNPQVDAMSISPPLPDTGLPPGWTLEQWQYYGQQYLDMNNRE